MVRLGPVTLPSTWDLSPQVCLKHENGRFNFYRKGISNTLIPDVVMPPSLNFSNIPFSRMAQVLKGTQHKLVELSSHTHKLYIDLKLAGGVNIVEYITNNPAASNAAITDQIVTNIPEGTFTYVQVSNSRHVFAGDDEKQRIRVIALKPGKNGWENFRSSLAILFGRSPLGEGYNTTALGNMILGVEETEKGMQDLRNLYERERLIYIYLSLDGLCFEVDIERSGCVIS